MEDALAMEKNISRQMLNLHGVATQNKDVQTANFIETQFLTKQIETINKLADYVTNLKRVGSGLGEYEFDKKTLSSCG
eukprot:gene19491-21415_t